MEVLEGITEHSSRVALKGVFANFGDVVACWVPPVDRRLMDKASVRFSSSESAEAAKNACDAGQVFLQGMMVKVNWRTGGGRRVGNSDLGEAQQAEAAGGGRAALTDGREGRDNRRRSPSRRRSRSRRRRDDRSRSRDRRRRERPKAPAISDAPAVDPWAPPPAPGAFSGLSASGVPPAAPAVQQVPVPMASLGLPAPEPAALFDPEEEARRKQELEKIKAERAKQLKRGPGVAALVQGALKRAQTTAQTKKPEEEAAKAAEAARAAKAAEEAAKAAAVVEESDGEDEEELQRKREEEKKAEEKAKKEKEEKEAREREKRAAEARERREKAAKEAAEAEQALQQREAENRDERIRASVEAAKKAQAERDKAKAAKESGSLYADMPQPDSAENAALNEARAKEAKVREKVQNFAGLPPEDRSKVVFLDIDGVLRPARAGGFDILSVEGEGTGKVDTSDFFPSAVKALRHIVERTGAIIVLSSEWRRSEGLCSALTEILEKNRMRSWAGMTTTALEQEPGSDPVRCFAERRAREVTHWLGEHEGDISGTHSWVVLDDINLAIADEAKKPSTKTLGPRLVQTWPLCGLTMGNAKTAVRILNGEMINKLVVERPVAPVADGGAA